MAHYGAHSFEHRGVPVRGSPVEKSIGAELWTEQSPERIAGDVMGFIVGVILFVIVVGVLDAKLPWPKPAGRED
jgi:hypothetical protein